MTQEPSLARGHARAAFVLSFSSFFVYPAIPIGASAALAIPSLLAGALTIGWVGRIRRSDFSPFAWMTAPLVTSASFVLLYGTAPAPDVVLKSAAILMLTFVIVIPTRYLLRTGYSAPLLHGAAYAVMAQSALGAYQALRFERSEFPFSALMRTSPGLAMLPETMQEYAEYVKRPFGLFPEPSAMAACLGPWLVLIAVALFTPAIQDRFRRHRAALLVALASGLAFVALSRSGQVLPIAAATAACAVLPALGSRGRWAARVAALVVGVAIIGGTVAWIAMGAASRFSFDQNDSWQGRLSSLGVAVRSLTSTGTGFFFGVGPGQSTWLLRSTSINPSRVAAIWSVALNFALETGVLGLSCMLVLGRAIVRSIWMSSIPASGAACAAVWLFGVVFGTSYPVLPPLWTAMAVLLSWRFLAGPSEPFSASESAVTERDEATIDQQ